MSDTEEDINVLIEIHKLAIGRLKKGIKYHEEKILILQGKTEICPHCDGIGKIQVGDQFYDASTWEQCLICKGIGRITKEELKEYQKEGAQVVYLSDMK